MADRANSRAPIDPKKKERVAELRGLGLTQEECAGACGISRASVDRIMSQPEYRKRADDIYRQRTSMKAEVGSILRAGLTATDSDGDPLHSVRQRAAELYAKNPELFDVDAEEGEDDGMLPGVALIFPVLEDETLTVGTIEVRDPDGEVAATIVNADQPEREDFTLPEDEPVSGGGGDSEEVGTGQVEGATPAETVEPEDAVQFTEEDFES